MVWIPAQSVSVQLERVGAYVGIASFFGIALLAVLYFAQARELKRLRDWAGRAPERARELEQRVAEDATRRAEEQAAPQVPPAPVGAVVAAAADANGRSAAATPLPADAATANGDAASDTADAPPPPVEGDATPADPATMVMADGNGEAETAPADGDQVAAVPAGAVPAADATDAQPPPLPAPTTDAAPEPDPGPLDAAQPAAGESDTSTPAAPRPATAAALRAGRPSTTLPRRPAPLPPPTPAPARRRRRGPGSLVLMGLVALLALVVGVVALSSLGGDDTAPDPTPTRADASPTATPTPDPAAERGRTTVAVLNGTTTTGLAAELVEQLTRAGYREGPRGNNADQQRAASVVLYREGFDEPARDVSRVLDIADVEPMDEQTAAQPIGDAQVVVIAGQDQAP